MWVWLSNAQQKGTFEKMETEEKQMIGKCQTHVCKKQTIDIKIEPSIGECSVCISKYGLDLKYIIIFIVSTVC